MTPEISVIIPTHNRLPCLLQCLDALAAQRFPLDRLQVIVVADGCSDGTETSLDEVDYPFALEVLSQPASGAAAARNRGAEAARALLLLFLDDDVIASPELVRAHVGVHSDQPGCVAVGPYLLNEPRVGDYLGEQLCRFWERTFERMADPEHEADAGDVLAGNLSLPAPLFTAVGGFNPAFPGCGVEDYEFGERLLQAGARVVYVAEAQARHLETTDLLRSLQRNRRGGSSSVLLARLHPALVTSTRLVRPDPLPRWLVFRAPRLGRFLSRTAVGLLGLAERLRMRRAWLFLYAHTRVYWYWRGVADAVSAERLDPWLAEILDGGKQPSRVSPPAQSS